MIFALNLSVALCSSTKFNKISGLKSSLSNFGFADTIVSRVSSTTVTRFWVAVAMVMVSIRVRFAEEEATQVPVLMSMRSLAERVTMGKEVRRLPDHWGGKDEES